MIMPNAVSESPLPLDQMKKLHVQAVAALIDDDLQMTKKKKKENQLKVNSSSRQSS